MKNSPSTELRAHSSQASRAFGIFAIINISLWSCGVPNQSNNLDMPAAEPLTSPETEPAHEGSIVSKNNGSNSSDSVAAFMISSSLPIASSSKGKHHQSQHVQSQSSVHEFCSPRAPASTGIVRRNRIFTSLKLTKTSISRLKARLMAKAS